MDQWKRARLRRVYGLRRSTVLLGCFVLGYVAYLVAGGVVFATLEGPVEYQIRSSLDHTISQFKLQYPKVSDFAVAGPSSAPDYTSAPAPQATANPSGDDDLESLIEEVVRASNRGVSAARNVSSEPNWSFGQSLFFSSTVVTTIGYGHVTPLSKAGKMFCMMYAMLGIPLTLVLLTALVERLMIPTTLFLQFLNSRLGHLYQPFNIRVLHLFIIATCHVTLLVLIPAAVFASLEPGWDYLDSLYYCFISLTTVGLGDYIPGDSPNQPYRPLYKVATTGYLLIGLTFSMLTLTIFYDIPQLNFGVLFLRRSDEATTDPEKVRLQTPGNLGPKYTQQHDDQHIPAKMDTPSPEDTTPVHARP